MGPTFQLSDLRSFLKREFNLDITKLKTVVGGEQSKAFSFVSQDKPYIIRVNKRRIGFDKDYYAHETFSKFLPIPKILAVGDFKDRYYAISEQSHGKSLSHKTQLTETLLENVVLALQTLH